MSTLTRNTTSEDDIRPVAGRPTEQLEVEDPADPEADIVFPTGAKLWLTMTSMCIQQLLNGLDLTIVAVAVPSLTDEFKTVADIGWYNAAYGLTLSAFVFLFGKLYTIFSLKYVFLFGIVTFEIGSLICTFATSSKMFVIGRAIAGLGTSATGGGLLKILRHMFPLSKQAVMSGIVFGCQTVGLVTAPVIGGALIDAFSWRACFGINLPLGVLCIALTAYGFTDPIKNPDAALPLKEKLKRIDFVSTVLIVPSIVCFLMALQWGGTTYGWSNWRIILLFVIFGILFAGFVYLQYRQGDEAMMPFRILKNRSILAAMWFGACTNGILAMTEYYIAIYFQGVRGFSATKSGVLGVPMIVGLGVAMLSSSWVIGRIGYFYPFMYATSILAPVASGILTTVNIDDNSVKASALLGFLGIAIGLGNQGPMLGVQASMSPKDVSIGGAIAIFGGGMGSALWISASATLFHNRLVDELHHFAPAANSTALEDAGLSEIREVIGSANLRNVLMGYNEAVVQTLYMPLALGILTIIGTVAMERRSLKKKQS